YTLYIALSEISQLRTNKSCPFTWLHVLKLNYLPNTILYLNGCSSFKVIYCYHLYSPYFYLYVVFWCMFNQFIVIFLNHNIVFYSALTNFWHLNNRLNGRIHTIF